MNMEKEWNCQNCGSNNWWSRRSCRECESSGHSGTSSEAGDKASDKADSEDGDPKVNAAAKVTTLEEALAQLGEDPLLATARQELEKELLKQRKLAKDTRSTAKKLDQKQHWIERESKRLEVETKRLAAEQENLAKRQKQLKVEIEEMTKLRLELSAEGAEPKDDGDMEMELTPENVAELHKMEERELNIRRNIARKRKQNTTEEASQEELGQWAVDADALTIQIDEKRKKFEATGAAKRQKS